VSWTDIAAPKGTLRYKIRRESVDKRYEWTSVEAVWPPAGVSPFPIIKIPHTAALPMRVELEHVSSGSFEVGLYDVQGRQILFQRGIASGSGSDLLLLDESSASRPVTSGIYFLRVRDSLGNESAPAKVVLLR
jgi:hypothetical protein